MTALVRPRIEVEHHHLLIGAGGLLLPRRAFLLGSTTAFLVSGRRTARAWIHGSAGISGFPGQPGNPVGFAAAPGYTGSLTAGGASSSGGASHIMFDGGTSAVVLGGSGPQTYNGCYFGSSSGATSQRVVTSSVKNTFNFCTFGPSPSVVGGSFPPQPPSGGGYASWPTLNGTGIAQVDGYQYGPVNDGAANIAVDFESCDIWGFANGIVFAKINSSNAITANNCWIHDPRNPAPSGDHTDLFGDIQSQSGDFLGSVTLNGCTVACFGNTQDLAIQSQNDMVINGLTVSNNYFAGNEVTLQVGTFGVSGLATPPLDYVFTGNVIGPTPTAGSSLVAHDFTSQFSVGGSGNKWRTNMILAGTYPGIGVVAVTSFFWPDGTAHATDFSGAF